MSRAREIIKFWVEEIGPGGWYRQSEELDTEIRERFLTDVQAAASGKYDDWAAWPDASLALLILLDQFPRNMFRGQAQSFSSDKKAICQAKKAIDKGFDLRTPEPQRQFYYMPLMHSESLTDQERCVRLMKTRMQDSGESNFLHARVHREVIRKFGRFPYRNKALDRATTKAEEAYMNSGGYQATLRQMSA